MKTMNIASMDFKVIDNKPVVFNVSPELVSTLVEQTREEHSDSVMVMAPISGVVSTHAPTKKGKGKDYFRIKCEIWIPKDAIQGEKDAIRDFGILALMTLPKSRVQEHLW